MKNSLTAKILILTTIIAIGFSAFIIMPKITKIKKVSAVLKFIEPNTKIKILIVPGHEPNNGGADEFKKIKERDLNLQLSQILKTDLSQNPNIEVILARSDLGWNQDLENYVNTNQTQIMSWVANMKEIFLTKASEGQIKIINPNMKHNEATSSAVLFLYGTNKWIEENKIDLVLHIHFNNNPKINGKPNFRGYCMYIPEKQYSNFSSSKIFAKYLDEEISKIENKSNMPQEKDIIIEDQELIAIGNYDTLKIPSVVMEYAYIYEPIMINAGTRDAFIEKAASSTATAINNFISNEMK